MFAVDPKVYSSMFSLPAEIADKELRFASGEQLKVIICIFRNPSVTTDELSRLTNLSPAEINECVEYWSDAGILLPKEPQKTVRTEKQNEDMIPQKVELPQIRFVNPTQEEIEKILQSNGSMKRLFNEAQEILGRTLGYTMQCTIYSIVNYYGIKPDVANCLLHFAKSMDFTSQNEIQKIAKYWAEHSITDMSAADDYITETEKAKELFVTLAEKTGNDTSVSSFAVLDMICEWIRWGYTVDEVLLAFDIMKAEKETGRLEWNNFRHMNGTIKKWRAAGIKSVEDIEKGTKKFGGKKPAEQKETSFDVELAEKQARENPKDFGSMKNKKRKRRNGA